MGLLEDGFLFGRQIERVFLPRFLHVPYFLFLLHLFPLSLTFLTQLVHRLITFYCIHPSHFIKQISHVTCRSYPSGLSASITASALPDSASCAAMEIWKRYLAEVATDPHCNCILLTNNGSLHPCGSVSCGCN